MRKPIALILLILVSINMVGGCAKMPESVDPSPTALSQLPTPSLKQKAAPSDEPDEPDIRGEYTFDEQDLWGEWIGRTYTVLSRSVDIDPKYKLNYENSIELKITLNADGNGWMSTVPFAERIAAKADHAGGGAKLNMLSLESNQIVLAWNGWEYPNTSVYGLPDAGELRLGFYAYPPYIVEHDLLNDYLYYLDLDTPFWETESNWSAAYLPHYLLVGDIFSSNGEFLYRITFDNYDTFMERPTSEIYTISKSNSDGYISFNQFTYMIESSTSPDGSIHLLNEPSIGFTMYQYVRYLDAENREHMLKFKATADDCRLVEIDNKILFMQPDVFSFEEANFFYYYWLNILEFDRNTGKFKYVSSQYPAFYYDVFEEYYATASRTLPPNWEKTVEGCGIAISKCYTFLLERMLSGKFNGTTTDDIVTYLGKHYSGPLPDYVVTSDEIVE